MCIHFSTAIFVARMDLGTKSVHRLSHLVHLPPSVYQHLYTYSHTIVPELAQRWGQKSHRKYVECLNVMHKASEVAFVLLCLPPPNPPSYKLGLFPVDIVLMMCKNLTYHYLWIL